MDGLIFDGLIVLGLVALALHVFAVTFTRALRTYSRSHLEDLCDRRGRPGRADDVARYDEATERSAEALAVLTGLALAALLGVLIERAAPGRAAVASLPIALALGALGYGLAGVVGRVFAERVVDALWPTALSLRLSTAPLTIPIRGLETLIGRLAQTPESTRRPEVFEVEIPNDSEHPDDADAELSESTRELVQHAVALTRRDVSELMTPRSSIVTLSSSVSARDAARVFRETGKSRLPVYGENRDDIVGILFAKDLFPRMTDALGPDAVIPRQLIRPAYCVPETKNAYDLLEEFRAKRTQIAIVLDEYGGVAGLITLEDLVEELVGAIDDEHDTPTPHDSVVPLGGSRYEVDASLDLESLNERLGLRLSTDGDYLTVGGLAFHELGRLPEPGVSFRYAGIEFQIVEVVDHSIRRVRLDLQPAEAVGSQ